MKAVVLLSGGLDSSTALYQAFDDGADEVLAVSFDYGSKHGETELMAAASVVGEAASYFGLPVTHQIVELPKIFGGGHSALMGDVEMPMEEYRDYQGGEGESITVVPFRNANLISAAVTLAEVNRFQAVYMGMHATDHGTWAYPDCTPEFLGAMAAAVYVGSNHRVRLRWPFLWFTKAQVVTRAVLLEVPVDLTWSCYEGGDIHCGTCPTCLERIKAFAEAGYADPVDYIADTSELFKGLDRVF